MKKISWIVLATFLTVSALSNAQEIVIGTEDGAGLWGDAKGEGAANDIVKAAFEAGGLKVTLKVFPYARAKALTEDGAIAGCFTMGPGEDEPGKTVYNATPLRSNWFVLVASKKNPATYKKLSEIPLGSTVGTVREFGYGDDVFSALKSRNAKLEESDGDIQNLKKLAAGRLDYALIPADELTTVDYYLKASGSADSLTVVWQQPNKNMNFVGFSFKNKDGSKAQKAFEIGLKKIISDGTYDRILSTWRKKL